MKIPKSNLGIGLVVLYIIFVIVISIRVSDCSKHNDGGFLPDFSGLCTLEYGFTVLPWPIIFFGSLDPILSPPPQKLYAIWILNSIILYLIGYSIEKHFFRLKS